MGTGWGCGGVHPRVKNFLRSTPKVKKVDTPTLIPPRWKKIGQIDPWGEHFFSFLFSKITPWWKGWREKILAAEGGRQIFWHTPGVCTPTPSKNPCPPMSIIKDIIWLKNCNVFIPKCNFVFKNTFKAQWLNRNGYVTFRWSFDK